MTNNNFKTFIGNALPTVVLSTASPYKFPQSVLKSINGKKIVDAFTASYTLEDLTAMPIPEQIKGLSTKVKRFTKVIEKEQAFDAVMEFIKK